MPNNDFPGRALKICENFGWMYGWEVVTLGVFAKGFLPKTARIVNVGAGVGTSGLALAEALPEAEIYTVDISAGGPTGGMENERNAFAGSGLRLPFQLLGNSPDVARNFNKAVDFVFIDADHSFESVVADIKAWRPKVRNSGYMAFHDYHPVSFHGVWSAVNEGMRDCSLFCSVDTLVIYKMPV